MYEKFILEKVKEIKKAFKGRKIKKLKRIQYTCIEHIAIEFDHNVFNIAIICYMLSKLISKPRYWQTKGINGYLQKIENSFDRLIKFSDNEQKISKTLQDIMDTVNTLDIRDKKYVHNLIEGAKIKIGSSLYSKGMTLGVASDLSGAERIEIMEYIGKTTTYERLKEPIDIKERMKKVRIIFG